MLENKKAGRYEAHLSRYIASWKNAGGKYFSDEFQDWLKSEGLTEEEIRTAIDMATMGKMELELSAKKYVAKEKEFIKNLENEIEVIKKKGTLEKTIDHLKYKIKKHFR